MIWACMVPKWEANTRLGQVPLCFECRPFLMCYVPGCFCRFLFTLHFVPFHFRCSFSYVRISGTIELLIRLVTKFQLGFQDQDSVSLPKAWEVCKLGPDKGEGPRWPGQIEVLRAESQKPNNVSWNAHASYEIASHFIGGVPPSSLLWCESFSETTVTTENLQRIPEDSSGQPKALTQS